MTNLTFFSDPVRESPFRGGQSLHVRLLKKAPKASALRLIHSRFFIFQVMDSQLKFRFD